MNTLQEQAIARRNQRRKEKERTADRSKLRIYDCMAQLSPMLSKPTHFDPYVQALDSTIDEKGYPQEVNLCFSGPPQHGKTEIAKHAFVSWATRAPGLCHGYGTYNSDRAESVAKKVKALAFQAGLNPRLKDGEMTLDGGTEIRFVGIGTALTGNPISGTMLIDDPTKDRADAESKVKRETNWGWFTDVVQTRRHPNSSCVGMATRWHIDDLLGRLIKIYQWPYMRIPAECDSDDDLLGRQMGDALWEAMRPSSWLQQFKMNPYTWASMYQGRPRPRGDSLFGEPTFYDELPKGIPYVIGHGVDLAYTEKTRADWSVMYSGRRYEGRIYVTGELRRQCQAPAFTPLMKRAQGGKGRILWYCSGTEKGVAQFIKKKIPEFHYLIASADKYQRATPCAEDFWNVEGMLALPRKASWTNEAVDEICGFTGVKDLCDDRVDAIAALSRLLGRKQIAKAAADLNSRLRGRT